MKIIAKINGIDFEIEYNQKLKWHRELTLEEEIKLGLQPSGFYIFITIPYQPFAEEMPVKDDESREYNPGSWSIGHPEQFINTCHFHPLEWHDLKSWRFD